MLLLGCLRKNYIKIIHNSCFYAISCLFEILVPSYHYNMGSYKCMVSIKLRDILDTQELLPVGSTEIPSPMQALRTEIRTRQKCSGRTEILLASTFILKAKISIQFTAVVLLFLQKNHPQASR